MSQSPFTSGGLGAIHFSRLSAEPVDCGLNVSGFSAKGMAFMSQALNDSIKEMMVTELMLQVTAAEIGDDTPLFGPDGLGLDSVDALQLVVALEKHFGLKMSDGEAAKGILASVNTIAAAITAEGKA